MGIGGARNPGADQSVDPMDADMVFIAKHRNGQIGRFCRLGIGTFPDLGLGIFDRPARITVFLPDLGGLPFLGNTALLGGNLLLLSVALLRCGNDGGVDDLPTHSQIASILECGIEAREQTVDCLGLHQPFAEQPDRGGIGHSAFQPDAQEALERQPVLDLEFGCLVRQRIQRLQNQDLEHEHRIERRSSALVKGPRRNAATSEPRNSSKTATAAKRSSGSPAAISASHRSERSKKPGCPAIVIPFQVTMIMNQLSASNARFFAPSRCFLLLEIALLR